MSSDDHTDIFSAPIREQCNELALVLASQSIESQVNWNGHAWVLSVAPDSVVAARLQIASYAAESRRVTAPAPVMPATGRAWPGIVVFAASLIVMALIAPEMRLGVDWLAAGRMDGGRMLAGDWWRPVTALTLHADAAHLLGNICFGGFFGYSVARYLGGGFGWLAIIVSGTLGNVANGFLAGAEHRSIGASTAVFAALGILSAYCWRRGFPAHASRRERMAPVIAGIGLLAFTGTAGVNTDIGAHLLGFIAGFGNGLLIARLGFPATRAAQGVSAAAAIGLVAVAWFAALS
jgi:membrane associated rhomboid family serine protease